MEQAVHELTGKPAAIYGLKDRGTIAVGSHADLLLFDPEVCVRARFSSQLDRLLSKSIVDCSWNLLSCDLLVFRS